MAGHSNTQGTEARGFQFLGEPGIHSESLTVKTAREMAQRLRALAALAEDPS